MQTYFSYANTAERGITGSNRLMRHNFNLRATTGLFRDRIKLDGNISFMRQVVKDKPVPGGFYMNPLVGLYRFPRGVDMTPYREHFEVYDPDRKLGVQNWIAPSDDFEQNPYWITNRIRSKSLRNRVMASLSADWKVNGWLRIRARGNVDHIDDKVRQRFYASTAPALAGNNGRYIESGDPFQRRGAGPLRQAVHARLDVQRDGRRLPERPHGEFAAHRLEDRVALLPQCVQRGQYRHEQLGLRR